MNFVKCLRTTLKENSAEIDRRGVRIEDECGDCVIELLIDEQVIFNACQALIGNAVKYNRPNGKIILSLVDENGRSGIVVSDSGIGMRPDKVKSITTSEDSTGLEKVKKMLMETNGFWHVESQFGVGTQITLSWPTGTIR